MIGGHDILIPTAAGASAIELALRLAAQIWPHAIYENAATGDRYEQHAALPLGLIREVLVYRDKATADKWDELGADPSLNDTLVQLFIQDDALTVVLDSEVSAQMSEYVQALRTGLRQDIFHVVATRRAA